MIDNKKSNIAISVIWYERYLECSRTYKTDLFSDSVWRFHISLINLGEDKLAIKKKVDDYLENIWRPKLKQDVEEALENDHIQINNQQLVRHYYNLFEDSNIKDLFQYITQTIQDSGIGWPTPQEMQEYIIGQE
jgi:hypothetical protein